jgi:hypothetical protein
MVVAPTATLDAGVSVAVATPEALVKAVEAGVTVASVVSVPKVTTTLGTTAPVASFSVAFTVANAPLEIELTVAPAESVSANVSVGAPGVPGVAGVPGAVTPSTPAPGLHPARTASVAAMKSEAEWLEIFWLQNFWAKKRQFFTQAPGYATRIDTVSLRWRYSGGGTAINIIMRPSRNGYLRPGS